MLPACNRGAGANVHFPDPCLTPPIPPHIISYTDTGYNVVSTAFVPHIFICGLNAHNLATVLAVTTGDEAGSLHWTTRGWSKYTAGNPIVFVGKLPGVHLTSPSIGNKGNAASGMCAVPSAVNVFYTFREEAEGGPELEAPAEPSCMEMIGRLPATGSGAQRLVEHAHDDVTGELVVRVEKVGASTPLAVRRAIDAVSPASIVLDLRGNPGGDLDAAVRLAELFLPRGSVVGHQVYGDGTRRTLRTRIEAAFEAPLRVLVDGGTASAAEVVACALKHHGRAAIVGTRTHGKGTVQTFTPEGLRTVAVVVGPAGAPIDGVGVQPSCEQGGAPGCERAEGR
jgi:carboxyl-terminal processing protease